MKLQFTTKSILLATAVFAIWLWGLLTIYFAASDDESVIVDVIVDIMMRIVLRASMPLWIPMVFIAYAIGRRSLSVKLVAALAAAELLAVAIAKEWIPL